MKDAYPGKIFKAFCYEKHGFGKFYHHGLAPNQGFEYQCLSNYPVPVTKFEIGKIYVRVGIADFSGLLMGEIIDINQSIKPLQYV